jgi:glycosyltransferase involved in cell wall biosynthesis
VIVPILNEEESLEEHHRGLRRALPEETEIIYVDDGSTDRSPLLLRDLTARDPLVVGLRLRRNFGKSAALAAGFRRARGRVIAMMDGDLQEKPEDLPRLIAKLEEGWDLVGGWRRRRRDRPSKVWGSWLFNLLVSVLGGVRVRDINCGLKVMRREVVDDLPLAVGFHRFIPLLAQWRGFRTVEVEIDHQPRRHGRSRYGGDRIFSGLLDLIVILFLIRYEGRPGRYFVALGSLSGAAGFLISLHLAFIWVMNWLEGAGSIEGKFPRLALGLFLMVVGIQIVSMGLFGELLAYRFRARGEGEPAVTVIESSSVHGASGISRPGNDE